jgi:hypothetical protein
MQVLMVVATWLADLPVAAVPLWQLAQLVAAVKVLWFTLATFHTEVEVWQLSQLSAVGK